jgi:hypothetical protein
LSKKLYLLSNRAFLVAWWRGCLARQCALFLVVHHFNLSACPHKPLLRKPDEIEAFLERGNSLCNMLRKRMLRTHGSLVVDVLLIAKTTMNVMAYYAEWIASQKNQIKNPAVN